MTLQRGTTCTIGSTRSDVEITVLTPPRSGRVTITNNVIIYQPRDAFVGNDVFVVERFLTGDSGGVPRRTLSVNVTVQRDPVVAAAAPAAAPSTWPACQVDAFTVGGPQSGMANPTYNANAASPTMRVRSGGSCTFTITQPRSTMSITAQPVNGRATIDGDKVRYEPRQGFVGRDTFTVRIFTPVGRPDDMTRFVTVNADVR
jgi:hypothetical protein